MVPASIAISIAVFIQSLTLLLSLFGYDLQQTPKAMPVGVLKLDNRLSTALSHTASVFWGPDSFVSHQVKITHQDRNEGRPVRR
jgi:hypothetical protein